MDKLAELTTGAKVVLGSAIVFLIISFFNWQEVDLGAFGSAGVSMWDGIGWIAGLLVIAIIAWQLAQVANLKLEVGISPSMVTAGLAVLLLVFTVIKFLVDNEFRTWAAWVGLILAVVVVVGAWLNMQAAGESMADVRAKLGSLGAGAGAGAGGGSSTAPPADTTPPAGGTGGEDEQQSS